MMNVSEIISGSPSRTSKIGSTLAGVLKKGMSLALYGPTGAGKTTFTRGVAEGFGIDKREVSSPTYSIINIYKGRVILYHVDLYRINCEEDIEASGIFSYPYKDGISIIEWPELAGGFLTENRTISIKFGYVTQDDNARNIIIKTADQHLHKNLGIVFREKSPDEKKSGSRRQVLSRIKR